MEGSAQRRLQLGVAKKIKNGARKIVLEKAEEARIAAFSAFKSLGLDIPQISRPLFSTLPENSSGQEATATFSLNNASNNFAGLVQAQYASVQPSTNVGTGQKSIDSSDVGLSRSGANANNGLQGKFRAEYSDCQF